MRLILTISVLVTLIQVQDGIDLTSNWEMSTESTLALSFGSWFSSSFTPTWENSNANFVTQSPCPAEQVYCLSEEACVPVDGYCNSYVTVNQCSPGQVICLEHEMCMTTNDDGCRPRDGLKDPGDIMCPSGYVFCLEKGECIPQDCKGTTTPKLDINVGCPAGYVFCMESESCVSLEERCKATTTRNTPDTCPPGYVYCLETERCILQDNRCERTTEGTDESLGCQSGYVYCLDQEMCIPFPENCDSSTHPSSNDHSCPSGYVYCLDFEMCVPVNSHCEISTPASTSDHICPPGYVYCLDWKRCVSQPDECNTVTYPTTGVENDPTGYVYCLDWERFVPHTETCDTSTHTTTSGHSCPPGQAYCSDWKTCVPQTGNCDTVTHPGATRQSCPPGTVYCLDWETCVPQTGSCNTNTDTSTSGQSCPPSYAYCLDREKCVPLADMCDTATDTTTSGQRCPFGYVYCLMTETCVDRGCLNISSPVDNHWTEVPPTIVSLTTVSPKSTTEISDGQEVLILLPFVALFGKTYSFVPTNTIPDEANKTFPEFTISCPNQVLEWKIMIQDGTTKTLQNVTLVKASDTLSFSVTRTEMGLIECQINQMHFLGVDTSKLKIKLGILTAPSHIVPEISLAEEIIYIEEDTELQFSGYSDIFNVTEIERAVKGFEDTMAKINATRFIGTDVNGTVASFKEKLEEMKASISKFMIYMDAKYDSNVDQVVRILRRANLDTEWSAVRSTGVVFILQDMGSTRLVPATDYVGNITITFAPSTGLQISHEKRLTLTVMVTPVNDAPVLRDEVRSSLLQYRYNTIQYPYSGAGHFQASSIASQLYRDIDGDRISIAVIGASQTNLGRWIVGQDGDFLVETSLFDIRKLKGVGHMTQKIVRLNPLDEVRFLLSNSSYVWQIYENPRLFIVAIDASGFPKPGAVRLADIEISVCSEGTTGVQQLCIEGGSSSYSRTVLDLYLGRQGCDGTAGSTLVEDECGVCGGRNDCFDCNGDPNGTAYYDPCDLSKCVGGNTRIKANESLDCAGVKCGKHYVHDKFGCIPVGTDVAALKLALPCDGQLLSDAFINECEICVLGTTGLAADAGIDACGVCSGDNSTCNDCAQVVNGDKVVDFCGNCRSPSDSQFNKGCDASLGKVYPKFIFAKYGGNLTVAGANLEAFNDIRCYLHSADQTRQSLETLHFNASAGEVKLALSHVTSESTGEYHVSCDLNSNKSMNVRDGKVQIYGNPTLLSLVPNEFTVGNISSVTIKGKNITDTGKIYCVIKCQEVRPEYGCQSTDNEVSGFVNFSAKRINSESATCDLSRLSMVKSARVYNLSIVTGEMSDVDLKSLSYVNLRVTSVAPKPLQAQYDNTMCNIHITFDVGITIREDVKNHTCADILVDSTKTFFEGAECRMRGHLLIISPGSVSSVDIGTVLTFKPGVIKRFSTSDDVASYATGSLTVLQPSNPIVAELILRSSSLVSACDSVSIKAHVQKRGCLKYTFAWKVTTTRKDTAATDPTAKVSALMAKIAQLSNDVIIVNGSELLAGFYFNFFVNLTTQFGDSITAEKIVSMDDTMLILPDLKILGGVQEVNPTEKIIITSSIKKSACIVDTQGNARYSWSIDADIVSDINSMKPRSVIPENTLRGGKTYKVTFTATFTTTSEETITGEASISFKTISSPLRPIISNGENFQHVIGNDLILDASLSYDPDKQTGVMTTYKWECKEKFGDGNFYPCWIFNPNTGTPELLKMDEGTRINFPIRMMREGSEFNFTLTMQKESRKASTISTVRIVASDSPQILRLRHTELVNTNDYLVIGTIVRAFRSGTLFAMVSNGNEDYEERALRKANTDVVKGIDRLIIWDRFDLVIPGEILLPGATYSFMTIGIGGNSNDIDVREEFKCMVNSIPKVGTAMITPTSGVSMETVFTVAIDDGWIDYEDEKNLQYYLYYWDGKEKKQIGIHSTAGEKSFNLRLPAGQFEIIVEACDSMQSCSEYIIPTAISVTTWNDHNRIDLLLDMARDAVETGDENAVNILLEVKEILEKLNLNNSFVETVLRYIDQFMEQLFPTSADFVSYDPDGAEKSLKAINELVSGLGRKISKEARNNSLKTAKAIMLSYSTDSSKRRRKRAISEDTSYSGITVSKAETILTTYSYLLLIQSEDEVLSQDSDDFQSMVDDIMAVFCATLKSYNVSPLVAKTNLVAVRAEKKTMSGMAGIKFPIGCSDCPEIINTPAKIQYGEEIASTYSSWNCSQDYLCSGLCLASAQITMDVISASGSQVVLLQDTHTRRSDLVVIKIYNPETNSAIHLSELTIPVTISFKINSTVDMVNNTLKCKVWSGQNWSDGKCDVQFPVTDLITDGDVVNCMCTVLGIISVFEEIGREVTTTAPPTTTSVTSTSPSSHPISGNTTYADPTSTSSASTRPSSNDVISPTATVKVTFTLLEDYASILGEDEIGFYSTLRSQLANKLGISPYRIINFSSKEGSIIVTFDILPPSTGSEKTTGDVLYLLESLITNNTINLTTSNGTALSVQVSSFQSSFIIAETTASDSNNIQVFLPYIIGGVIGGAVVIGLAVLILVVLMKMKQQQKTYPNVTMPTRFSNVEPMQGHAIVPVWPVPTKTSVNKWTENELYPPLTEMNRLKQNKMNFNLVGDGQYEQQVPSLATLDEDNGIRYSVIGFDRKNTTPTDPKNDATSARAGSTSSNRSTPSRNDILQVEM